MKRLPTGNEPVLGQHLIELTEQLKTASSNLIFYSSTISNSGPTYLETGSTSDSSAAEEESALLIPRKGSITNLSIYQIGGTDSKRLRYTLRLNGADTALSLTLEARYTSPRSLATIIPCSKFDKLTLRVDRPDGSFSGSQPTRVLVSFEII